MTSLLAKMDPGVYNTYYTQENPLNTFSHESPQVKLSKREIEVLTLINEGYLSGEAAERLFISRRTVEFHLQSIYEKLNVSNRMRACRCAVQLGLIGDD
jgi:DNA-binding NarL/FixJ family response regulator